MKLVSRLLAGSRFWPLFMKELHQLKRNRRLIVTLIIPPTVNVVLFGFALNPEVNNLRLGVVDGSRTAESREFTSAFVESGIFEIKTYYGSSAELSHALNAGELDAGLVLPEDFARQRARRQTAEVQFLVDAVNSNTAFIAGGYASRIVAEFNLRIAHSAVSLNVSGLPPAARASVMTRVALLFNPGLINAWFIVTGMIGTLLVIQGSLVSAAAMVREKEIGTVEQLLMTPAGNTEIILAKIGPIFLLLTVVIGLALNVGRLVFGLPARGSLLLFYFAGALCVLCGIGIGTFIATITKTQQQAQLVAFFVIPPIALLSGATTPIEAMPYWLQPLTYLNPVRHFATISRGVLLKGVGLDVIYPNLLALIAFAVVIVGISVRRFRKQLG